MPDGGQHGQVDDANAPAEIAAVHRNHQFENGCAHDGRDGGVMRNTRERLRASCPPKINSRVAPSINQGSTRMKVWAGVPSRRNAPMIPPLRPAARRGTSTRRARQAGCDMPLRWRSRRSRGRAYWWRWPEWEARRRTEAQEGHETASAGDRVQGPTQSASDKKEDGLIERQG